MHLRSKVFLSSFSSIALAFAFPLLAGLSVGAQASEQQEEPPASNTTVFVTPGGDDSSYQIPLTEPVVFFGQTYSSIYATTNAVITFGAPDGTFWDYPMTPSISLGSQDWVAFPDRGDEHFIISYTPDSFQVDMSVRPYGASTTVLPSRLILSGYINPDRTINFTYYIENTEQYPDLRFGVRTPDGEIRSLEDAGFTESTQAPSEPGEITPPASEPQPLNPPSSLSAATNPDGSVLLSWSAPEPTTTSVERYAIFWSTSSSGWAVSSLETSITITAEQFASTGGLDVEYNFTVRADNDSLSIYSAQSEGVLATPSISSQPEPTEQPTPEPEPQPEQPIQDNSVTIVEGQEFLLCAPEGQFIKTIVAWYGDPNDPSKQVDVSDLLQDAIGKDEYLLQANNNLFGDPAPGIVKILYVVYEFEAYPATPEPEPTPSESPTPEPTPEPQPVQPEPEPIITSPPAPLEPIAPEPTPTTQPEPSPEPEVIPPSPTPSPEPEPEPTPIESEPTPTETPAPMPEPTVAPSPTLTPTPTVTPQPSPTPTATTTPLPTPTATATPSPSPTAAPEPKDPEAPLELKEEISSNNIVALVEELVNIGSPTELSTEQVLAIQEAALGVFNSGAEQGSPEYEAALDALLVAAQADDIVVDEELAAVPVVGAAVVALADAFNALGNAGADMSPEVREQSEKVVIAAVIVGQIALTATSAATSAAAAAARIK